jgi:hypothetical protein
MAKISRFRSRAPLAAGAAATLLGVAGAAHAGPVETLVSIAQHPTDPKVMVVQYEDGLGGLLFSRDGGETFQIHPSTAFTEYGTRGYVPALLLGDGKLLLGLTDGLVVDDGQGCAIEHEEMARTWITDLARHPTDASVSFVLTSGTRSDGSRTGIWLRAANGTISALAGTDTGTEMGTPAYGKPLFFTKSLRVLARPQNTLRFVEVGSKNVYQDAMTVVRTPTFRYSDDSGATWTEHAITGAAAGDEVVLLAVTDDEPMKVVVGVPKTGATEPTDLVLLSTDGGATFAPYIEGVRRLGQAVVTPDGRFYLADMGATGNACEPSGLWAAASVGATAERIVDYPVRCLGYDSERDALLLCKAYEVGAFYPNERAYCRLMEMNQVDGFVACSGADDLSMKPAVDEQLCGAWCGELHLASSSFCATASCGLASRAYDVDAGWVEPPGIEAPSCTGFDPATANSPRGFPGCDGDGGVPDAGPGDAGGAAGGTDSGGTPGGGAAGGGDAGSGGTTAGDAGAGSARDGGGGAPGGGSDAGNGAEAPMETDEGCDCSVRAGHKKLPDLAGFGVALWLIVRNLRARKRRADA